MKLKNSPGAVAAIGRVLAHVAKARLELKQAERELFEIRGLTTYRRPLTPIAFGGTFLTDIGLFTVLDQMRGALAERAKAPLGLRLVAETPEEGP